MFDGHGSGEIIELEYVGRVLFSDTLASCSEPCMGRNHSENEIQAAVRVNQKKEWVWIRFNSSID